MTPFRLGKIAAIALTKPDNGILGSNNLCDIQPCIRLFHLQHRTRADIMAGALGEDLIGRGPGNTLWCDRRQRNCKLPPETLTEFLASRK